MARGLPEGLVSNRVGVRDEIERVDRVEAEDVQQLWRVYSTKKTVLADNIGRRLENFFWRIWSSERIRDRISGNQVAVQFSSINEGGYIRTTPRASPRSSRSLGSYYEALSGPPPPNAPSTPPETSTEAEHLLSGEEQEGSSVTPTPTSPLTVAVKESSVPKENRRSTTKAQPPPILKESSSGSSGSSRNSTLSSMQRHDTQSGIGAQHEEAVNLDDDPARPDSIIPIIRRIGPSRRSTTTRFNEEVAISIPRFSTSVPRSSDKPRRSSGDSTSSQRSGRRNPVVVASTGASRRRPAVLPRRSSGTSSLGNSRTSSYSKLARSPKFSATNASVGARQGAEAQATRRARAVSPHPSKQRRRLSPGPPSHDKDSGDESEKDIEAQNGQAASELSEETSEASEDDEAPADKPLIDPNFRSKFVDKTLSSQRSVTNLPAFAQKSSAAVATAAYFQATGLMGSGQPKSSAGRGKGREAFTNVTAALKAPASAGPEAAGDDNPRSLTKTKSQLTLLLEKEKALSSDQEQTFKKPDKP